MTVPIVDAGPAGLAAAITVARQGGRVRVFERRADVGARFHDDFEGLESWTAAADVLAELADMGIAPALVSGHLPGGHLPRVISIPTSAPAPAGPAPPGARPETPAAGCGATTGRAGSRVCASRCRVPSRSRGGERSGRTAGTSRQRWCPTHDNKGASTRQHQ